MAEPDTSPPEAWHSEAVEVAVGTAILGLRRLNIARRELVESHPDLVPLVDAVLDRIEGAAVPLSAAAAEALRTAASTHETDCARRMRDAAPLVEQFGPKLLDMSGLIAR